MDPMGYAKPSFGLWFFCMLTRPASACSSLADPGCGAVRGDHRSSKQLDVRLIFTICEIHNCSRFITYSHIYIYTHSLYIIYCIIYSPYVRFFPKIGDSKKQTSATPKCVVALTRDRAGISQVMAWSMPWPYARQRSTSWESAPFRCCFHVEARQRCPCPKNEVEMLGSMDWLKMMRILEIWWYIDDIMLLINVVISCYIMLYNIDPIPIHVGLGKIRWCPVVSFSISFS